MIYAPYVFLYQDSHSSYLMVGTQIIFFNFVAVMLGWLVDRQRHEHQRLLSCENLAVLGHAATLVGHEMNDLLGALKRIAQRSKELQCTELDRDFEQEMARLQGMVDILSSFAPAETIHMISRDLNPIIREQAHHYRAVAKEKGIKLEFQLDENGCPSQLDIEKLGWILGHLIQNAMEVSAKGQSINIRSKRNGNACQIEVQDQGPGIRPEHLPKIFSPFFTTKENGYGLALAGCKKILKDLGGNIQVSSKWGEGALFAINIPRDKASNSLSENALLADAG
jgi:signal transduction histidine kinase